MYSKQHDINKQNNHKQRVYHFRTLQIYICIWSAIKSHTLIQQIQFLSSLFWFRIYNRIRMRIGTTLCQSLKDHLNHRSKIRLKRSLNFPRNPPFTYNFSQLTLRHKIDNSFASSFVPTHQSCFFSYFVLHSSN